MSEQEEWRRSVDAAPTIQLKLTRLRTYLAQLHSASAHGGPSREAEKVAIRREIDELKKES